MSLLTLVSFPLISLRFLVVYSANKETQTSHLPKSTIPATSPTLLKEIRSLRRSRFRLLALSFCVLQVRKMGRRERRCWRGFRSGLIRRRLERGARSWLRWLGKERLEGESVGKMSWGRDREEIEQISVACSMIFGYTKCQLARGFDSIGSCARTYQSAISSPVGFPPFSICRISADSRA